MSREPKRRMSDKLEKNSDHDLLIRHSVKIDSMFNLVTDLGNKFDQFAGRVDKRCERRQTEIYTKIEDSSGDNMDRDTFKWLMGFVILIIMAMVSAIGYNQVKIRSQESAYEFSIDQIKKNQKSIEKLQQIISLKLNFYDRYLIKNQMLEEQNNNDEMFNDSND
jgi:hypothetical protein